MAGSWPLELEVLVEPGVEGPSGHRLEGAAHCLVLYFNALTLYLLVGVLLLDEAGCSVGAWTGNLSWFCERGVEQGELALGRPESSDICLPLFGDEGLLLGSCRVS